MSIRKFTLSITCVKFLRKLGYAHYQEGIERDKEIIDETHDARIEQNGKNRQL